MDIDQESFLRGLGNRVGRELTVYGAWDQQQPGNNIPQAADVRAFTQQFTQQAPMRAEYAVTPVAGPKPSASVVDARGMYERTGVPTRLVVREPSDVTF